MEKTILIQGVDYLTASKMRNACKVNKVDNAAYYVEFIQGTSNVKLIRLRP